MYYPIQIPYILNKGFSKSVKYTEEVISHLRDFVICFWEMQPILVEVKDVNNVILADGCIDLVVDYGEKKIGFSGVSKTLFKDEFNSPCSLSAAWQALHPVVVHDQEMPLCLCLPPAVPVGSSGTIHPH